MARLATVVCYQGLDALLYSVLEHPSVNAKIFEPSGGRTIGVRKALAEVETHLQGNKTLRMGRGLPYRNQIDRPANVRDEVVHKALAPSNSECRRLVGACMSFAVWISREVFGLDIIE